MYLVGIPHLALSFFSAASALVAIPTAVQIFAWLATLSHGRPRFSLPMLYFFRLPFHLRHWRVDGGHGGDGPLRHPGA
jgi:cytochrome c oxidase subunit I+III